MTAPAGFDPRLFVESAPWRSAKTMVYVPHEYLVQHKVPDEDGSWAFVAYIAEHDWAMPGRGNSSITIINRERLPGQPIRRVD